MGDKEADCQGRRYLRNRKSRNDLHADGDGAERLGPLPGEGWVWVTKRRTVKDAGTSEQKSRNDLRLFCSEVPSRIELLYTVLQTLGHGTVANWKGKYRYYFADSQIILHNISRYFLSTSSNAPIRVLSISSTPSTFPAGRIKGTTISERE